ncbi:uncharacterized protein LOC110184418 [Drosophila serrata]|uniref:uncharacterized protein LOC110184418 n=1 Tax=Drosophila serrata TaxID=7274 RepID=UPI000A1D14FF|nr:uncharacterized protein LOC110184418 [Drosophila serrata]
MSDRKAVTCVLNVVLCGATGFGFVKAAPAEHPWAFTACLIGFCHGLTGLLHALVDHHDDEDHRNHFRKAHRVTSRIMEIIPLPLVNVDLYLAAESNNIALAHGMFLVPLGISMILGLFRSEVENEDFGTLDTLKVLTILGNITSLVFLAINDSSWKLGGMAFLAFMAKFGAEYVEDKWVERSAMPITYISWSGFFILAALAVSGEK